MNRSYLYSPELLSESHAVQVKMLFASPMELRHFVLKGASVVESRILTHKNMSGAPLPTPSPIRYVVREGRATIYILAWASAVALGTLLNVLDKNILNHEILDIDNEETDDVNQYGAFIAIKNRIDVHCLAKVVTSCLNTQAASLGKKPLSGGVAVTSIKEAEKRYFKGLHHMVGYHHQFKHIEFECRNNLVGQWSVGHLINNGFGAVYAR